MNAIFVMLLGLAAMFLGYVFYSKFVAEKIYKLDPNFKTPAHEFEDGVVACVGLKIARNRKT